MKICTLLLVALTTFVFIAPANGQRRKRETQPQQPQTEQTTPSGNGRRAKTEAARTPSVPCTLPISSSPNLRGLALNLTPSQVMPGDRYFDWASGNYSNANGFISSSVYYPRATPRPGLDESMTPEQRERLDNYLQQVKPEQYARIQEARRKTAEEARNAPKTEVVMPNQVVKKMAAVYYGRGVQRLYNYQIQYVDDFAFENEDEIKQNLAENLKIPVGSWVPIPDPAYNQKVLVSVFSLLDFRLLPVENIILRQADCNGWRAVFVTSPNTTGLFLSIINSSVADNLDQLIAQDQKEINDAQKQKTKKIFKP